MKIKDIIAILALAVMPSFAMAQTAADIASMRKDAAAGNIRAQVALGNCYLGGKGVKANFNEAVKWYRKAAELGDANAQSILGICYYEGEGVTQDNAEAVKWYRMASGQDDAGAQYILGLFYSIAVR